MNTAILQAEQFGIGTILLRLCLALLCGGIIGLERAKKHQSAGFRTYMLVCLGSTLTMLLGQYEYYLTHIADSGSADVSRLGAQVINGIGFIATGTILVTDRQEVKGLTTAAALWASACMGLAIGVGFYECVAVGILLIFLCIHVLPFFENRISENSRYMNLYIGFQSVEDVRTIAKYMKSQNWKIYGIDIEKGNKNTKGRFQAAFSIKLPEKQPHSQVVAMLYELDSVSTITVI